MPDQIVKITSDRTAMTISAYLTFTKNTNTAGTTKSQLALWPLLKPMGKGNISASARQDRYLHAADVRPWRRRQRSSAINSANPTPHAPKKATTPTHSPFIQFKNFYYVCV